MNRTFLTTAKLATVAIMTIFISACNPDTDNTTASIPCEDINTNQVWEDKGDGIDYILDCTILVNAKLTIEPGVNILVKSGAGIMVETGGTLVAAGTSTKEITFKAENDVAGVWRGIYVKSNDVQNELTYCNISNGGGASFDGNTTKLANVRVGINAKLKLLNCVVAKSAKDGLLVDGFDSDNLNPITAFSSNTFNGNQNYPISAIASVGNVLDGTGSTYTGNTYNKVLFRGGRMYGAHTWKKMNVPYLIQNIASAGYYNDFGSLTIEPGVNIQFAGDAGLCTGDYSTGSWLSIVGTSTERITLTGETLSPGAWKGVAFQSTSPNNRVSYADISYGGSSSYTGATQKKANLHAGAWSNGTFTIDNTSITNSEAWGIWVTLGSPAITVPGSVVYSSNASGNYYAE